MSDLTQYRIYCTTEGAWVSGYGSSTPVNCYNNVAHTVNANSVQILADGSTTLNGGVYTVTSTIDAIIPGTGSLIISNGGLSVNGMIQSSGVNTVNNTTVSSSTSTGSLIVKGGIGLTGSLFGTTFNSTSTIDSSSSSTGSIVTAGGLGVGKSSFFTGQVNILNTTNSVSFASGSIIASGGLGIAKDTWINGLINVNGTATFQAAVNVSGQITSTNTVDSSASNNGSVILSGGIGIVKSVSIGGTCSITNTTASSSTTTGALLVTGGIGTGNYVYAKGFKTLDQTASSDTLLSTTGIQYTGTAFRVLDQAGSTTYFKVFTNTNTATNVQVNQAFFEVTGAISGTPSLNGSYIRTTSNTFTDNNTAVSGTAANMVFHSFSVPTLAATNTGVTTTSASTVYIAGAPITGTNQTITNAYALKVANGNVILGSTTDSSGSSNGSFIVSGGVGIAKKIYGNSDLNIAGNTILTGTLTENNTTNSTSTATGSVILAGGLAVVKDVYLGGLINVAGAGTFQSTISVTGIASITNTTDSSSSSNGSFIVSGGIGVAKKIYGNSDLNIAGNTILTGTLTENNTTNSTSTATGSVILAGGLAVVKDSWHGGLINVAGSATFQSTISVTGIASISNTTESSSSSNGSFVVSGGVGIAKKIYGNSDLNIAGNTILTGTLTENNTTNSTSTATGSVILAGGLAVVKDVWLGGLINVSGTSTLNNVVSITNTTVSSSNTTGSLIVSGGIGISGSLFTAGVISISLTTDSSSTSTGSIVTSGGLGVAKAVFIGSSLNVANIVTFSSTVSSTSSSTGALVLSAGGLAIGNTTDASSSSNGGSITTAGGLAVGKQLIVGGNLTVTQGSPGTITLSLFNSTGTTVNNNIIDIFGLGSQGNITDFESLQQGWLSPQSTYILTTGIGGVGVARPLSLSSNHQYTQLQLLTDGSSSFGITTASSSSTLGAVKLAGGLSISNTTDASSSSNGGSITTAGGLAVAKRIISGTDIIIGNGFYSNGANFVIAPNGSAFSLQFKTTTPGLSLSATTDSSSTITGSFVTSGGIGVAKNANFGSSMTVAKNFNVSSSLSGTPSTTGAYVNIGASTFTDNNTATNGTVSTMAFNSFAIGTLAATNPNITTTNASTVYIAGAPTAGTNETITNAYSLYVPSGDCYFGGFVSYNQPTAKYTEEQSSATNGGSFTTGAWRTRLLNTSSIDVGSTASALSSNTFTLDAGTYIIKAWAMAYNVNGHQIRFANTTDSTFTYGSTAFANSNVVATTSQLDVKITIAATKTFSLQHQCSTTRNSTGFGLANGFGSNEIYSEVFIIRLT